MRIAQPLARFTQDAAALVCRDARCQKVQTLPAKECKKRGVLPGKGRAFDNPLALCRRQGGGLFGQPAVAFGREVSGRGAAAAEQVEQLPVLRARGRLAPHGGAQHSGQAIVEQHFLRANPSASTGSIARIVAIAGGRRRHMLAASCVAKRDNYRHTQQYFRTRSHCAHFVSHATCSLMI